MIDIHLDDLAAVTSTRRACELLGRARASHYRHLVGPVHGPPGPRPAPPNKLSEAEQQNVLTVLRSTEYCDLAPAQVWARLLDDGIYLCSVSTMYRLLGLDHRQLIYDSLERPHQLVPKGNIVHELIA